MILRSVDNYFGLYNERYPHSLAEATYTPTAVLYLLEHNLGDAHYSRGRKPLRLRRAVYFLAELFTGLLSTTGVYLLK